MLCQIDETLRCLYFSVELTSSPSSCQLIRCPKQGMSTTAISPLPWSSDDKHVQVLLYISLRSSTRTELMPGKRSIVHRSTRLSLAWQVQRLPGHLRFVHQGFVLDGIVQWLEEIFGEVDAIIQFLQIITELLEGHFRADFLKQSIRLTLWLFTDAYWQALIEILIGTGLSH